VTDADRRAPLGPPLDRLVAIYGLHDVVYALIEICYARADRLGDLDLAFAAQKVGFALTGIEMAVRVAAAKGQP
jgi:hypothetical protein